MLSVHIHAHRQNPATATVSAWWLVPGATTDISYLMQRAPLEVPPGCEEPYTLLNGLWVALRAARLSRAAAA